MFFNLRLFLCTVILSTLQTVSNDLSFNALFTFHNLSVLLGPVPLLKISIFVIERLQKKNFWNRVKDLINFGKHSRSSVIEIFLLYASINVTWNLFCNKVFHIQSFVVTWFTNFERYLGMYILKNLFNKRIKSFIKKDYDPVILQRTSRLVIDPSTVNSHAFLFGCAVIYRF